MQAEPLECREDLRKNRFAAGKKLPELGLALIERGEALFRVAEFGFSGANAAGGIEKVLRELLAVVLDFADLAFELRLLLARALQVAEQAVQLALTFGPFGFLGSGGGCRRLLRLLCRGGGEKCCQAGEHGEAVKGANHEAHSAPDQGSGEAASGAVVGMTR